MDGYVPPIIKGMQTKLFNPEVTCEVKYPVCA
jgi:sphingomyelin phosphodiesterase